MSARPDAIDLERARVLFEAKCIPEPNSGCWLWTAALDRDGYGKFQVTNLSGAGPKQWHIRAHVFSHLLYRGPVPPGLFVLHACDVPSCVNPDHLRAGTQKENIADMDRRGRRGRTPLGCRPRGEAHPRATLTEVAVREIRARAAAGERRCDLARLFGVTRSAVYEVVRRRSWRHVA